MPIEFTEEDDRLVERYLAAALHQFKDGAIGFEETLGNLTVAIDLIAKGDTGYRAYMQASIDGQRR